MYVPKDSSLDCLSGDSDVNACVYGSGMRFPVSSEGCQLTKL